MSGQRGGTVVRRTIVGMATQSFGWLDMVVNNAGYTWDDVIGS